MPIVASLVTAADLEGLWNALGNLDPQLALLAVFVLLFLAGCGLPLPEDIPLTFTGILLGLPSTWSAFGGMTSAIVAISLVCYSSILTGDLVAYHLGKKYGKSISRYPPFKWAMSERRIARMDRWFARFGNSTVFFGRMVAGIRFVTFVMAGMARMPLSRFVLYDSLAALVTVPAWIVLGYIVGTHFHEIVEWMSTINTTTWAVLGALALLFVVYRLVRSVKWRRASARSTAGKPESQ